MATTITDYIVLSDGSFELDGHLDSKVFEFDLPNDFVQGTNLAKPILAYIINPLSGEVTHQAGFNDLQMLQSQSEVRFTHDARVERSLWEAVNGNKLNPGQRNTCYFMTVGAGSRARFRDVILWFQRSIDV